jgi:hypothetical protein
MFLKNIVAYTLSDWQIYKLEVSVDRSQGLQAAIAAAVGPAVAAAVGPAIEAAVGPAITAAMLPMNAWMLNQDIKFQNHRLLHANLQAIVRLPIKSIAGHPPGIPDDAVLQALPIPVPITTAVPLGIAFAPAGGWSFDHVIGSHSFTAANLDDLEWFYNDTFAGANIAARKRSFLLFLGQ